MSTPCCSASARCSRLRGLFGSGRAIERQDDGEAPRALFRLPPAVEGEPADGRANETFARPVGCQQRQQLALAVPRPVPVLIEAADDHAHRRLFDAAAEVGDHDIVRLRSQKVVEMLPEQWDSETPPDVFADKAVAQDRKSTRLNS